MKTKTSCLVFALLALAWATFGGGPVRGAEVPDLEGILTLTWGDPEPGVEGSPDFIAEVRPSGIAAPVRLLWDDARFNPGLLIDLNGKWVRVSGFPLEETTAITGGAMFFAENVTPAPGTKGPLQPNAVVGPQPWVTVMCKFSDYTDEPKPVSYFQSMYGTSYPELNHYWKEQSYDTINVDGSTAGAQWYVLPQPRSYYVYGSPEAADLTRLFTDATAVADPYINYSSFVGINLMFNRDIGPYAWGGTRYATLDGTSKIWYVTWEPPWGYQNVSTMQHEMGHGFGLPHSCFSEASVYDNSWDVMSNSWLCNPSHATYGCVAEHTIAYHKDMLGWIPTAQKVTVNSGSRQTVTLERLAQPQNTNVKYIKIPIGGSATHFYSVEARKRVGYDAQLLGESVIVHDVDTTRQIRAHVMGSNGSTGAMIAVGSSYVDSANCITVKVDSSTSTGFVVTVSNAVGPTISTQPQSVTITSGQSTTLTVAATGTGTISFQWYQGASGVVTTPVGTNSSSYTTPSLTSTTSYWVKVTDSCGATNSNTATVTVNSGCTAPSISTPPAGTSICRNLTATLSVVASGTPPLNYQWYRGNSGVTTTPVGTNANSFTTPNLTANTNYWVRVSNACGTADSPTATVTILAPAAITAHPQSQTITSGQTVTLYVSVTGAAPLSYGWYKGYSGDTSTLVGTSPSFTSPILTETTRYWVRVSNGCGSADSNTAVITVSSACVAPSIASHPAPASVCTGTAAALSVAVSGTPPFNYQWYQGNSGDTSLPVGGDSAILNTAPLTNPTSFWVRVSNACGTANSNAALITPLSGPTITTHPVSQTIPAGQTATLSVTGAGVEPLSYQWYQGPAGDASRPVGANTNIFITPALTTSTPYWVRLTDNCGSRDSDTALVTVTGEPVYTTCAAQVAASDFWWTRFSIANLGDAAATYQFNAIGSDGVLVESAQVSGIPPKGAFHQNIATLFTPTTLAKDLWVAVSGNQPLKGVLEFGTQDGFTEVVMPMQSQGAAQLYFPYAVVVDTWYTGIVLIDTAVLPANVTLYAYNETGTLLGTEAVVIPARGKYVRLVDQAFPTIAEPWLIRMVRVDSDQPLIGFELFGNLANPGLAGLPAVPAPPLTARGDEGFPSAFTMHILELLPNDQYYTGITTSNRGAAASMFQTDLFDREGRKLAGASFNVLPYQQVSREVWALFNETGAPIPGAVRLKVNADQPILGFELYFTRTGSFAFDGLGGIESGSQSLAFPLVRAENGWSSRVRLFNPGLFTLAFTLKAWSADGSLVGSASAALPGGAVEDVVLSAVFPENTSSICWLSLESSQAVMADLFFIEETSGLLGSYPGLN